MVATYGDPRLARSVLGGGDGGVVYVDGVVVGGGVFGVVVDGPLAGVFGVWPVVFGVDVVAVEDLGSVLPAGDASGVGFGPAVAAFEVDPGVEGEVDVGGGFGVGLVVPGSGLVVEFGAEVELVGVVGVAPVGADPVEESAGL